MEAWRATSSEVLVANITHFVRVLRQAGLRVSLRQETDFLRAIPLVGLADRARFRSAARAVLVSRQEDFALFSRVFEAFWRSELAASRPVQKQLSPPQASRSGTAVLASLVGARDGAGASELEVADRTRAASDLEALKRRDFGRLSDEELQRLKHLIAATRWRMSERRSRRFRAASGRSQQLDFRRVLRRAASRDGVVLDLLWRRPKIKQRPLVLLADISGSMELYSRLVLQFFHALSQRARDVESFVFGTRLTRVTSHLRLRSPDQALAEVGEAVVDWSGGTRIGESLGEFNRRWSRRVLRRGAVVLVVSDGLERGEVDALAREMRFLRDRCHRVIWLNPLLGGASYEPLARGMAAALPHIDDFLPVHSFRALEQLSAHLATLPARSNSASRR